MSYGNQPGINGLAVSSRLSRRVMLRHACALGFAWAGVSAGPCRALAAPVVTVAAPTVDRINECLASYSIRATLTGADAGVRYEMFGYLLEWDEDLGESDVCCLIAPTPIVSLDEETTTLLEGQTLAADLGLVKGIGPASDERHSPDLVEVFARVWLRDLATNARYGPWDSPHRVAVARDAPPRQVGWYPGSEFVIASRPGLERANDAIGRTMPPKCAA